MHSSIHYNVRKVKSKTKYNTIGYLSNWICQARSPEIVRGFVAPTVAGFFILERSCKYRNNDRSFERGNLYGVQDFIGG